MKEFKIRASGCGNIMGDAGRITDKQLEEINTLEAKPKLTDIQQGKLDSLINKRDNPELSDTAKSFLQQWVKEQLYDRRKEFGNKYTDKGITMEDDSLDYIAEHLGYGLLIKNEEFFNDDFMQGTPDAILPDHIIDVKNSWDCFTFPLFDTEIKNQDYYWQAQVYMNLLNKDSYKLIYTLMDTPFHIIEKEFTYNNPMELEYDEFSQKYLYGHLGPDKRIKVFDIKRNDSDIAKIKERVLECRAYIKSLLDKI